MIEQPVVTKSKLGDLFKIEYQNKVIYYNQVKTEKYLKDFYERQGKS